LAVRLKSRWCGADISREEAGRGYPQVRGDRHVPANHNASEALVFTTVSASSAARPGCPRTALRRLAESPRRVHTSLDPATCGIGNLQVTGVDSVALAKHLFDTRRIIVVPIKHDEFEGLRVTPCVYTTTDEVDRFAEAIEQVIAKGLPA
jgi:selenocysteine lyase/cysteine desulfurase